MNESLITYSLPRPFFGMNIPIPMQSAFMRDYAQKNNFIFQLPAVEICFRESHYVLLNTLKKAQDKSSPNICMSSVLMLPIFNYDLLRVLVSINSSFKWHFPLEGMILNGDQLLGWIAAYKYIDVLKNK